MLDLMKLHRKLTHAGLLFIRTTDPIDGSDLGLHTTELVGGASEAWCTYAKDGRIAYVLVIIEDGEPRLADYTSWLEPIIGEMAYN